VWSRAAAESGVAIIGHRSALASVAAASESVGTKKDPYSWSLK